MERILVAVECVPVGRVVSYGDIAALVGTGPRVVGRVMASSGSQVAWWRVTNAAGELPGHLRRDAHERWAAEGITLNRSGTGCRIVAHRAALESLAASYDARLPADLRPTESL